MWPQCARERTFRYISRSSYKLVSVRWQHCKTKASLKFRHYLTLCNLLILSLDNDKSLILKLSLVGQSDINEEITDLFGVV